MKLGLSIMPIILAALFIIPLSNLNANAQNSTQQQQQQQPVQPLQQQSLNQTASPQQIKQLLADAITALNNGNNTQAAKQIELADEKIKSLPGTQFVENENDDDKNKNSNEGEGE